MGNNWCSSHSDQVTAWGVIWLLKLMSLTLSWTRLVDREGSVQAHQAPQCCWHVTSRGGPWTSCQQAICHQHYIGF